MVGIVSPASLRCPILADRTRKGFIPTRKTEERLPLPVRWRSPVSQRTVPRERETVMHLLVCQSPEAASGVHSSRLVPPPRRRKRPQSQWFSGPARRSEQAKLTACRKVGG